MNTARVHGRYTAVYGRYRPVRAVYTVVYTTVYTGRVRTRPLHVYTARRRP